MSVTWGSRDKGISDRELRELMAEVERDDLRITWRRVAGNVAAGVAFWALFLFVAWEFWKGLGAGQ